jgi:hypothetical protein
MRRNRCVYLQLQQLYTIRVQSFFRMAHVRQSYLRDILKNSAAITVQHAWRFARTRFVAAYGAVVRLQSLCRMVIARRTYMRERRCVTSAVLFQRYWRCARIRASAKRVAAVEIQRIWRSFWAKLRLQIEVLDIVAVQSCARRYVAAKLTRRRKTAVETLQKYSRVFVSRRFLKKKREWHNKRRQALRVSVSFPCLKYAANFTRSLMQARQPLMQGVSRHHYPVQLERIQGHHQIQGFQVECPSCSVLLSTSAGSPTAHSAAFCSEQTSALR